MQQVLIQYLESLRRAGVTHLPRSNHPPLAIPELASPAQAAPEAEAIPQPATPKPTSPPLFQPRPIPGMETPKPSALPVVLGPRTASNLEPCLLSRAEREAELSSCAERVKACMRCAELVKSRTQTVFGVGNPEAEIMFLGEAPGADEDREGEPFVGKSGKLLNDIIKACKLTREEIYICNILRCRPPANRTPLLEEAENCREYLDAQIALVDPAYIICWGAVAAKNLLRVDESLGKLRGKFHQHGRAKVLCTYHPSFLLRKPEYKRDTWEDMKFFRRDMGVEL